MDKLNALKREFYIMLAIPRPKPPPTHINFNIQDFIKNEKNLEELIVNLIIYNFFRNWEIQQTTERKK